MLLVACGLFVLVMTIAWLSGMFEEKVEPGWTGRGVLQYTDQPTDIVHEIEKSYIEEAVGTLKASSRTVVSSKLLATIAEIRVTAGDQVEQGQELIRLDSKEYEARLDQAKRALEAGVKQAAFDRREYKYHGRVAALADAARDAGLDLGAKAEKKVVEEKKPKGKGKGKGKQKKPAAGKKKEK